MKSTVKKFAQVITTRIRSTAGGYVFTLCVCSGGRGTPVSGSRSLPGTVGRGGGEGTPVSGHRSPTGGRGVPLSLVPGPSWVGRGGGTPIRTKTGIPPPPRWNQDRGTPFPPHLDMTHHGQDTPRVVHLFQSRRRTFLSFSQLITSRIRPGLGYSPSQKNWGIPLVRRTGILPPPPPGTGYASGSMPHVDFLVLKDILLATFLEMKGNYFANEVIITIYLIFPGISIMK